MTTSQRYSVEKLEARIKQIWWYCRINSLPRSEFKKRSEAAREAIREIKSQRPSGR